MAGHSHAKNVRATKAAQDLFIAKRNTQISRRLFSIASSNPNPSTNTQLADEIMIAESMGFPKESIEKILKTASVSKEQVFYQRQIVEAIWNNISFIIVVETDNKARILPQIKSIINRVGGIIASPQTCLFRFKERGMISFIQSQLNMTREMQDDFSTENDAEDYRIDDTEELGEEALASFYYYKDRFKPSVLIEQMKNYVKKENNAAFVSECDFIYLARETQTLAEDKLDSYRKLIDLLNQQDDVVAVFDDMEDILSN